VRTVRERGAEGNEEGRRAIQTGGRERKRENGDGRESRNKNRINGPSYHARWAIKYRRKYPLAVRSLGHPRGIYSPRDIYYLR